MSPKQCELCARRPPRLRHRNCASAALLLLTSAHYLANSWPTAAWRQSHRPSSEPGSARMGSISFWPRWRHVDPALLAAQIGLFNYTFLLLLLLQLGGLSKIDRPIDRRSARCATCRRSVTITQLGAPEAARESLIDCRPTRSWPGEKDFAWLESDLGAGIRSASWSTCKQDGESMKMRPKQ